MARENVKQVFAAWLDHRKKKIGPVSTDGEVIRSYSMPLLVRVGNRVILAKKARGAYTTTTAQHLSSLHELISGSDDIQMSQAIQADAEDVKKASYGGNDAEEVIIKYADLPHGRIVADPWKPNPVDDPVEEFRRQVQDPDPAAMMVAEDIVTGHGLSLAELGEQWLLHGEDTPKWAELPAPSWINPSIGWFNLGPNLNVGWIVHRIYRDEFEIEIIYNFLGEKIGPHYEASPEFRGYTAATSHNTYFKSIDTARRAAAADAWDAAKTLKQFAAEWDAEHERPLHRMHIDKDRYGALDVVMRSVNRAVVDPTIHKTAPAVFGGKKTKRTSSRFERYNPPQHRRDRCKKFEEANDVSPIAARLEALENPGNTGEIPSQRAHQHCKHTPEDHERMGWTCDLWPVGGPCCAPPLSPPPHENPPPPNTPRGQICPVCAGRTDDEGECGECYNCRVPLCLHGLTDEEWAAWANIYNTPCDRWQQNPRSVFDTPRWRTAAAKLQSAAVRPPPPPSKKNPGELDAVTKQIEKQILTGIAGELELQARLAHEPDEDIHYGSATRKLKAAADGLAEAICKREGVNNLVDLYAIVMEIDTGEPFAYEYIKPKPRPEPELLFDANSGTTIPQRFAREINRNRVRNVDEDTWNVLELGDTPENEGYWEAWDDVVRDAALIGDNDQVYFLDTTENGDVFMVPQGMVFDEEWRGESYWMWEEPPELPLAEQFGRALALMALREDPLAWFREHKQRSDDGRIEWQPNLPQIWVDYDGRQFTWSMRGPAPFRERRIRVSYETDIPPEDDEGEWGHENGWVNEEGEEIIAEEGGLDDGDVVTQAVKFIQYEAGSVEPSSSAFSPGVWYTQIDGRQDYETGEVTKLSFQLHGFTEDEQHDIFRWLTRKHP